MAARRRAIFSKKLGACAATSGFFRTQALLYVFAAVTVGVPNVKTLWHLSAETAALGAAYGVLTLPVQGMYTVALKTIFVSSCAMIYSFGFVIPAVFGTLAFKEPVSPAKIYSVLLCAVAVVFSAPRGGERAKGNALAALSLVIAMIASGGLGMVQKRQQRSACAAQTGAFLRTAFLLAGAVSALAAAANTLLAGILPSIVVFPVTNVGVILASLAVSVLFLKERLTKRRAVAACLGIAAVVLFSLPL